MIYNSLRRLLFLQLLAWNTSDCSVLLMEQNISSTTEKSTSAGSSQAPTWSAMPCQGPEGIWWGTVRLPPPHLPCLQPPQLAPHLRLKTFCSWNPPNFSRCPLFHRTPAQVLHSSQLICRSTKLAWWRMSRDISPLSWSAVSGQRSAEKCIRNGGSGGMVFGRKPPMRQKNGGDITIL